MGHPSGAVRPRYSRITAAGTALVVTSVAVLGAAGILPTAQSAEASSIPRDPSSPAVASLAAATSTRPGPYLIRQPDPFWIPAASSEASIEDVAVPADSGEGRRVVFDMTQQRVWLVTAKERVVRSYLVSGSLTNNLDPGSYEVYSKSRDAIGIDDSGTMKFMVRFAHGRRAAIGFHDIPVHEGERVQTREQLGTPQSHGCIRQLRKDARALWEFAPVGTTVVVVR